MVKVLKQRQQDKDVLFKPTRKDVRNKTEKRLCI